MSSLVIVANRLPVELGSDGEWRPSPGGLASALSSVVGEGVTWVGWSGANGPALKPFTLDGIRIRPVGLSEAEATRYYGGFSNAVLWPLFHGRLRREEMNRAWWRAYRAINDRFAANVARVAAPDATVWIHDYHLLLVPRMLRLRRPDLRIGLFLHIPFPNSQLFSMLPWRQEVVSGMLGADLLGFQVPEDSDNFLATVARVSSAKIDGHRIVQGKRHLEVAAFPISVDFARWDALGTAAAEAATSLRAEMGGRSIFLGIDRLDYTKGITQRLQAFEELLQSGALDPGTSAFVQVAVPSRSDVPAYQDEQVEVSAIVERINRLHTDGAGRGPVRFIEASLDDVGLAAWYRAADVLVVTSLADGMNLVAKEFVAARSDLGGVLVLSEFAGASHDLAGAFIINPYDVDAIKQALLTGRDVPAAEVASRMETMRDLVRSNDVHHWARSFLHQLEASPAPGGRLRALGRAVVSSSVRRVSAWRGEPS
jgi:trehalose 6-phosphate synthase